MTIDETAKLLNIASQTLRIWCKSGNCPFGYAFQGKGKSYVYIINEYQLNEYLGNKNILHK